MNLPGKLSLSTLGDLLGMLHRAGVSGVLSLRETRGVSAGRCHRIHLQKGLPVAVETAGVSEPQVERLSLRRCLEQLFQLEDAALSFHVARKNEANPSPLTPAEFLHGRPRRRDREAPSVDPRRRRALAELGLPPSASGAQIRQAFREKALLLHPDRHPSASPEQRAELNGAFARLTQAYQTLSA